MLNLETSLIKHLNKQPFSTEWLEVLRDYCDSRIAVRNEAKAAKAFITPSARFDWDIRSIMAARGA